MQEKHTQTNDNSQADNGHIYSADQRRIGGIRSGAARRFKTRDRQAAIRAYRDSGMTQQQIAETVGCHQSTVSRVLNGVIKTVLSHAETALARPWADVMRELSPRPTQVRRAMKWLWRGMVHCARTVVEGKQSYPDCGFNHFVPNDLFPTWPDLCPYCGAPNPNRDRWLMISREIEQRPDLPVPEWWSMAVMAG